MLLVVLVRGYDAVMLFRSREMLRSLSGCGIRRPKCPKTMEEEMRERGGHL